MDKGVDFFGGVFCDAPLIRRQRQDTRFWQAEVATGAGHPIVTSAAIKW
ncbi:hypothetical protein SARI_01079 [Salmonella enterica subsp. arizonae serovar 62:z4,z23:-]|uniref:Uncharacterized protein n=1 Tax=Salmonella arizonae (strain ATCC BAA-731 / CDC346-86 / RSK2980) TaxID=41514 RepID=A9MNG1_SALAR|nr:hypothetical protein SARI_01079 [Salmonella enterica subsp. arizonae serovar 62:z4,z23:-]